MPPRSAADILHDLFCRFLHRPGFLSHLRSLKGYDEPEILPYSTRRNCLIGADAGQRPGQGQKSQSLEWEETKPGRISNIQANLGGCRGRDLLMPVRDSACSHSPSNMRSAITRNSCSRSTRGLRIISALLGGGSS